MTLKDHISSRYGAGIQRRVSTLSRDKTKLAKTKNHVIFLERCLSYRIIPTFLRSRCPIKSKHANKLTKRYQLDILRAALHLERKKWHKLCYKIRLAKSFLVQKLNQTDYNVVNRISESTYERNFTKVKQKLKEKFEKLKSQFVKESVASRPSLIKNPILQLQKDKPLTAEMVSLLSLGPKFAVTPKEIPKMEIISATEKSCQKLERKGEKDKAQVLRHEVAEILKKAPKPKPNLTGPQRRALTELRKDKEIAITPFDKGQGFVVIEKEKLVEKAEKEIQNVTLDTPDTTSSLERKIQGKLRDLKKQGKIDDATYKNIYPSGSTTPTANPAIKAHKPAKEFPARLITSHINAPQENIASHLNDILKPFIANSPHVCKNSFEFVEKLKKVKLRPHTKLVSYDATALFPSVPINDALKHILDRPHSPRTH